VVLAACFGVMAGFGSLFVYTFTVFVKPLGVEFGWSREAVSSGFAIGAVTVGPVLPAAGPKRCDLDVLRRRGRHWSRDTRPPAFDSTGSYTSLR
jgi:hypothetical protein